MFNDRTDLLLALLYTKEAEEVVGTVRLMKELFLLTKILEGKIKTQLYKFLPYDLGPVSFEVYEDLDNLEKDGLLIKGRKNGILTFKLSKSGIDRAKNVVMILDRSELSLIKSIKNNFNRKSLNEVIEFVYRKYPNYTKRSIIK